MKTISGCYIGNLNFTIFNIPNVFTPGGDGNNDSWKISGFENYPGSELKIFDRFGYLVLDRIINGVFSWDGKLNGRQLASGNYWYNLKLTDGRILNGYVLIKNR